MPNPELEARKEIDRQLEAAGWAVQDYKDIHLGARSHGIAVREYPLATGHVDYLLYADGRVIATVEAKPAGYPLTSVEPQSGKYVRGLPADIPAWRNPIPFAYETTGVETRFTNGLDPEPRSRRVFTFHRPEELRRLAGQDVQLRGSLQALPPLDTRGLWSVQEEAVRNLEASLAANRPRSLIQMATGSGKTYTAVTACYRLIKFGGAKRILFLVDRNNLGRQTLTEFQRYVSPYNGYTFTEEFQVQRLTGNAVAPGAKVVITTIQRLYSMLRGEESFDEGNEEQSLFESGRAFGHEPQPVAYNPRIPPEFFDVVIVDECHRSIYNVWRQVVEYFDAFLIGLTATPGKDTLGFFNQNLVQNYGHERAVVDGVNVGYDVYRIRTRITEGGATLPAEAGLFVPHRDRRTRAVTLQELDEDLEYAASELDRDVVAEDQIRTVVRTFRDRLFTEIFPGRTNVPKTLVFAKDDSHAEDIVRVIREEFGKGNEFCQKITSKTTGVSAETLLSQFRNTYMPRIAVTVDMIATGTDVRALECLLFMRNINSASYFEQMKGRGVRIIGTDDLQSVTPDATSKSRFVIVDAVGVCERDKTTSKPLDRQPTVPLDKLLQAAGTGVVHPDLVSALAARLTRLDRELEPADRKALAGLAGGRTPTTLAAGLLASLDADAVHDAAVERFAVPEGAEPTQEQLDAVERERMAEALKPFLDPALRKRIVEIRRVLDQVLDEITRDDLLAAGFDGAAADRARSKLEDFRRFLEENREEIEALQILYSQPYRAGLRYRHVKELADALRRPPLTLHDPAAGLWSLYEAVEPEKVRGKGGKMLVDLVQIVRHALAPDGPLVPRRDDVQRRYHDWLTEKRRAGIVFTADQTKWLDAIKDHIVASLAIAREDFEEVPFSQMGGLGKAYEVFGEELSVVLDELNERLAA